MKSWTQDQSLSLGQGVVCGSTARDQGKSGMLIMFTLFQLLLGPEKGVRAEQQDRAVYRTELKCAPGKVLKANWLKHFINKQTLILQHYVLGSFLSQSRVVNL